jgi:tetratricopeptide (TPR) repeat protein
MRAMAVLMSWLVLAILLACGQAAPAGDPPLTPAQKQQKLKERDQFSKESAKLESEGKLEAAITAAEGMLAVERALFEDTHPDIVGSLKRLARLHERLEAWATGSNLRQEILTLQRKRFGEKHWQVTDARLALEQGTMLQGLSAEQRQQLEKARLLQDKANVLAQQGKSKTALPLAEEVLSIRKAILKDHPDTATSLNYLAQTYRSLGDYATALPLYEQARELRKKLLTENHPDHATSLNNLAMLYQTIGDYAKALPLMEQARDLYKELLTENHPLYATSLSNLGYFYK